jgi:DNA-binding protein
MKEELDEEKIFIGSKPLSVYTDILYNKMTFKGKKEMKIVARGRFISKAVDVEEIVKNKFLIGNNAIYVDKVILGSKPYKKEVNGKNLDGNVSTIEIVIKKLEK